MLSLNTNRTIVGGSSMPTNWSRRTPTACSAAAIQGGWRVRALLPAQRAEMAWTVAYRSRMHLACAYA